MYIAIGLLLTALGACIYWLHQHYGYWRRLGVAEIRPTPLVGNLGALVCMRKCCADFIRDLYNHPTATNEPFVGIHLFYKPALLLRDPALIKRVLIKDFSKFCNRYSHSDLKGDPIGSQNLFFLKNPVWKEVRLKLTPFFTSGRLKHMLPLIDDVGRNLNTFLLNHTYDDTSTQTFTLEMKEFCAWYTTDVIATVAYGVEANTFKNPNGEFRCNGRKIFKFNTRRAIEFTMIFFLPHLVPYLGLKVVSSDVTQFLRTTINHVMAQRELSGQSRNDLIDILIEFKNASKRRCSQHGIVFEGDILVAQAAIFFTAGFESSSATMAFALYELAKHPDLQARLREELRDALAKHEGQVTQRLIDSLEYMQMVIDEVLRLYPPLPFLDRECVVESGVGYSLDPYSKYNIPNGMPVYVPVFAIHRDPKYYPNPDCFDPERFGGEQKKNLTPYTYMPFGLGSHACVGERFAMLQSKIGLLYFLKNHCVRMGAKSRGQMKLDPKAIIVQAEGGIHLDVVRDPLVIG